MKTRMIIAVLAICVGGIACSNRDRTAPGTIGSGTYGGNTAGSTTATNDAALTTNSNGTMTDTARTSMSARATATPTPTASVMPTRSTGAPTGTH